jgi:DNA-binding NarL/FixJ family response regulator
VVPTEIVLFEDNSNLRQSLTCLLAATDVFVVTGNYGNCTDAVNITRKLRPHVVLMDIDMPGDSGINAVSLVKGASPSTAVVMYAVFEDDDKLFKCLCAGASGYLLKKTQPSKIADCIFEVMNSGAPISPNIARQVLAAFNQKKHANEYSLSPRETEVLQLLIKGYSVKTAATQLGISFDTGRAHLRNVYQKLHINYASEAVAKVVKEKIV